MITTAGFFKAACDAGLHLIGEDNKSPVFAGSELRLSVFRVLCLQRDIEPKYSVETL